VLMTSDHLGELGDGRGALFADLLATPIERCHFPRLGQEGPLIEQLAEADGRVVARHLFNPTGAPARIGGETELGAYESRLER